MGAVGRVSTSSDTDRQPPMHFNTSSQVQAMYFFTYISVQYLYTKIISYILLLQQYIVVAVPLPHQWLQGTGLASTICIFKGGIFSLILEFNIVHHVESVWLCKFEPSSREEKPAELINRAVWRGRRNECDLSWPTRPPTPAPSSWPPWSPVENLLTSLPVPRLALLDRYTTIYLDMLCWLKMKWYGCEWNTPLTSLKYSHDHLLFAPALAVVEIRIQQFWFFLKLRHQIISFFWKCP